MLAIAGRVLLTQREQMVGIKGGKQDETFIPGFRINPMCIAVATNLLVGGKPVVGAHIFHIINFGYSSAFGIQAAIDVLRVNNILSKNTVQISCWEGVCNLIFTKGISIAVANTGQIIGMAVFTCILCTVCGFNPALRGDARVFVERGFIFGARKGPEIFGSNSPEKAFGRNLFTYQPQRFQLAKGFVFNLLAMKQAQQG